MDTRRMDAAAGSGGEQIADQEQSGETAGDISPVGASDGH
jgi:hypothetical protein